MDNGVENAGADRDQWFDRLLGADRDRWFDRLHDAYNTAARFLQQVRVVQAWLLDLRFRATQHETLNGDARLASAYKASLALDMDATILCDNLQRAMAPRNSIAECSTDTVPEAVKVCAARRKELVSAMSHLHSAVPEAVAAWKAHLTLSLTDDARNLTADLEARLGRVRKVINDFKTMTGPTRARFESSFRNDFAPASAHLDELCLSVSKLASPEVLAYFDQSSDWSKAEWVSKALETVGRGHAKVVLALEHLGRQASKDGRPLGKDSLTELEEEVKRLEREMKRYAGAISQARSLVHSKETPNVPIAFADQMEVLYASCAKGEKDPPAALIQAVSAYEDSEVAAVLLLHAISQYPPFAQLGKKIYLLTVEGGGLTITIRNG
jgi:hypothetical protein